jgi:hypothetical protein
VVGKSRVPSRWLPEATTESEERTPVVPEAITEPQERTPLCCVGSDHGAGAEKEGREFRCRIPEVVTIFEPKFKLPQPCDKRKECPRFVVMIEEERRERRKVKVKVNTPPKDDWAPRCETAFPPKRSEQNSWRPEGGGRTRLCRVVSCVVSCDTALRCSRDTARPFGRTRPGGMMPQQSTRWNRRAL